MQWLQWTYDIWHICVTCPRKETVRIETSDLQVWSASQAHEPGNARVYIGISGISYKAIYYTIGYKASYKAIRHTVILNSRSSRGTPFAIIKSISPAWILPLRVSWSSTSFSSKGCGPCQHDTWLKSALHSTSCTWHKASQDLASAIRFVHDAFRIHQVLTLRPWRSLSLSLWRKCQYTLPETVWV